jgi:hypothetical protein
MVTKIKNERYIYMDDFHCAFLHCVLTICYRAMSSEIYNFISHKIISKLVSGLFQWRVHLHDRFRSTFLHYVLTVSLFALLPKASLECEMRFQYVFMGQGTFTDCEYACEIAHVNWSFVKSEPKKLNISNIFLPLQWLPSYWHIFLNFDDIKE